MARELILSHKRNDSEGFKFHFAFIYSDGLLSAPPISKHCLTFLAQARKIRILS